jgi:Glycosyl transferase family 2
VRSELAVVVLERPGRPVDATLASVGASAGADVEVVVVRPAGGAPAPAPADAPVLDVLPLGGAYARNRGLAATSGEVVAFLDGGLTVAAGWAEALLQALAERPAPAAVVGPVAPRLGPWPLRAGANLAAPRETLLAVRGLDHDFGAAATGVGDEDAELVLRLVPRGRVARVPGMAARGGQAGRPDPVTVGRVVRRRRSLGLAARYLVARPHDLPRLLAGLRQRARFGPPPALLDFLPAALRDVAGNEPPALIATANRSKTHFVYRTVHSDVLHVYANPAGRLRRALAERESIRERAGLDGIPAVHAVAEAVDSLWVLETLVPGQPPDPSTLVEWLPRVVEWAVRMAGPPGPPLERSEQWLEHRTAAIESAPRGLRRPVAEALDVVGRLPARHMHGDFQRYNLLVSGDRVGAVDWEGAWLEGIPGLDLVFAALLAASDRPDPSVVTALARGEDAPWGRLREALRRVGVDEAVLPAALLAMLATWSLGEARRRTRLGGPPGEAVFGPLLDELGPELALRLARPRGTGPEAGLQ